MVEIVSKNEQNPVDWDVIQHKKLVSVPTSSCNTFEDAAAAKTSDFADIYHIIFS